ncbi:MAG: SBBP repeat-containing protein, partial [Terriglobales bacterium]
MRWEKVAWLALFGCFLLGKGHAQTTCKAALQFTGDFTGNAASAQSRQATQPRIAEAYGKLPLSFESNQGQTDSQVKFLSRGRGYTLFLTRRGDAVLALRKPHGEPSGLRHQRSARSELPYVRARFSPPGQSEGPLEAESRETTAGAVVRMKLVGANPTPRLEGLDELPGKSNYFIGNDPNKWRTNVPNYARVRYREVYSGVDLVYYGNQRQLEYDFIVAPGADPKAITLDFQGADKLSVDAQGDLMLRTQGGELRLQQPLVYQEENGQKRAIPGHYVFKGKQHRVGFQLGAYDVSKPLVIDPVLSYSTYLGGSGGDAGFGIAVDSSGNAYVTGATNSTNFPTANPFQAALAGSFDAFVTKLSAAGNALVYSTYLGGIDADIGFGIAVDASGNAYVTGRADSTNFPTANPFQAAIAGGGRDAFVTKISAPTISDLINLVMSFNLQHGIANSLDAKLQNAQAALDAARAGDLASACKLLNAFINEVQA